MNWQQRPSSERLQWMLICALLLHGLLLFTPLPAGKLTGQSQSLSVRLLSTPPAEPAISSRAIMLSPAAWQGASVSATTNYPPPLKSAPQLGLDVYYPASELQRLAEPIAPIEFPDLLGEWGRRVEIQLKLYINEQGSVDAVQLISAKPAGSEQSILPLLQSTRFTPAQKDGIAVKSYKIIRIEPERALDQAVSATGK
ncbi:energy transducer TonB [Neisseriaceae bacterium TC5R-5]|nr:energy transducer TonB [Neisseriaceae bacterium TC5R-5]